MKGNLIKLNKTALFTALFRKYINLPKGDSHITTTQAYRILAKAGDRIGRHDIGHTMRKTFGYQFYTQTKDLEQLMTILNHSSQKITLRYIGITKETIETSIKSVTFF